MGKILTITPNPALDIYTETETLFDDKKMYCEPLQYYPGGGGVNLSRVVSRLDGNTHAMFYHGGQNGQRLCSLLGRENIEYDGIVTNTNTREVFNVVTQDTGKIYRFVTTGGEISLDCEDKMLSRLSEIIQNFDFVVGSGSLPLGGSHDFYSKIGKIANENGVKFVLDTSGQALLHAAQSKPYLLRMNQKEFNWLKKQFNIENFSDKDFEKYLIEKKMCQVVIHTLGSDGAIWFDGQERYHVRPPKIKVKSSVGAGDSFLAALILSLSDKISPLESLTRGMAAAAATLSTPGTELCIPEEYHQRIKEIIRLE